MNLQEIVNHLKNQQVVAYPTEAVFGLGCNPNSQSAVENLLVLKQRPMSKGLILIAPSLDFLEIQNAAKNYAQIDINCIVNVSDLTDRIYMINTAYAFPIGSYALASDYEQIYFNSTNGFGNHCYEG